MGKKQASIFTYTSYTENKDFEKMPVLNWNSFQNTSWKYESYLNYSLSWQKITSEQTFYDSYYAL